MWNAISTVQFLVTLTSGLLAFILNSWILAVNIRDQRGGVRLSPCDQILTLIGCTNLATQTVLSAYSVLNAIYSSFMLLPELRLVTTKILIFLISCNLWLTVWLSVYYCIRIVDFRRGIFFLLKMRMSALLPKLLFFSVVESFALALSSVWAISFSSTGGSSINATENFPGSVVIHVEAGYFVAALLGCIVPITLILVPIGLTLASLWRHTNKMKKRDFGMSQMQAHLTAARTMILLTVLYVTFYTGTIGLLSCSFNVKYAIDYLSWYCIVFYPVFQAIVLITGNTKLRKPPKLIQNHLRTGIPYTC
ncbi:taste receptor type 2 member 39-like [Pelodytes ibericus]